MPRPATRSHGTVAVNQSISNFTRVSKSHASLDPAIKKVALEPATTTTTRKRKATSVEEDSEPVRVTRRTVNFPASSDDELASVKRTCRRQEPVITPKKTTPVVTKGKKIAKATPRRSATAHKPVEKTIIAQSKQQGRKVQTKIDAAFKKINNTEESKRDQLPPHLAEILDLHKAFMKTLTFHIAHHGTASPIPVNDILPNITRTWGKRNVSVRDIEQLVALHGQRDSSDPALLHVTQAHGRVCIVATASSATISLNGEALSRTVADNLLELARATTDTDMVDAQDVLANLSLTHHLQPGAGHVLSRRLGHSATGGGGEGDSQGPRDHLMAKGHAALSEFKSGIAAKQQEREAKQVAAATPMLNPDGTKMGLLDRLRHKQLAKANGPLPPSGPELERRAALNRVSDIAATISMLSLSNPMSLPRQAFTMAVIMEKLKDSLRTPISKEEGAACVRLIASEVAPEWLRIVAIGGRENVVVQRLGQPIDRIIKERVQKLLN